MDEPAARGAAAGAVAISIVGFRGWAGCLAAPPSAMAADRTQSAVIDVLTPICVEKFHSKPIRRQSWSNSKGGLMDQRALIEKGGWAATPGSEKTSSAVAAACAEKLGRLLDAAA